MSVLSQLGRYLPSKNVMGDYSDEEIYSIPECVLSVEKEDIRAKQNDLKEDIANLKLSVVDMANVVLVKEKSTSSASTSDNNTQGMQDIQADITYTEVEDTVSYILNKVFFQH